MRGPRKGAGTRRGSRASALLRMPSARRRSATRRAIGPWQLSSWIDEGHLCAYRNRMLYHPSSVTGRAYSRRTINGSVGRPCSLRGLIARRMLIARLVAMCQGQEDAALLNRAAPTNVSKASSDSARRPGRVAKSCISAATEIACQVVRKDLLSGVPAAE
jgi:hypothetical protein